MLTEQTKESTSNKSADTCNKSTQQQHLLSTPASACKQRDSTKTIVKYILPQSQHECEFAFLGTALTENVSERVQKISLAAFIVLLT